MRRFPARWYVRVRVRVADQHPHYNGWSTRSLRFRTRANARAEYDHLVTIANDDLTVLTLSVWGRQPHRSETIGATLDWGSVGERGKRHDTTTIGETADTPRESMRSL